MRAWRRLRNLWRGGDLAREFDEEIAFHLEQRVAANLRQGMTPAGAAAEARTKKVQNPSAEGFQPRRGANKSTASPATAPTQPIQTGSARPLQSTTPACASAEARWEAASWP